MSYKDDVPSGQGLDGLPGFHVKKGNYPHTTQFLTIGGPTVFRPYPCFQNGVELPLRVNEEQSNFTDWIKAERLVKMMGVNNKFTCLTRVKGKDKAYRGPIENFSEAMHKAIDKNARAYPQEWELWIKGKKGQGAKLPWPDTHAFIQGMLFESDGKRFVSPTGQSKPKYPVIMALGRSARTMLQNICNQQVPGFTGNPEDYAGRYACGDLVSCAHGKLLRFVYVPQEGTVMSHYNVEIVNQEVPLPPDFVSPQWIPWDTLLDPLTDEQQLNLLVSHFPPEPVDFVFKGTQWYDMLPDYVRGKRDAMLTGAVVGGFSPAQPAGQPVVPANWPPPAPGYQYMFNSNTNSWAQVPAVQASPPPPMAPVAPPAPPAPPPPPPVSTPPFVSSLGAALGAPAVPAAPPVSGPAYTPPPPKAPPANSYLGGGLDLSGAPSATQAPSQPAGPGNCPIGLPGTPGPVGPGAPPPPPPFNPGGVTSSQLAGASSVSFNVPPTNTGQPVGDPAAAAALQNEARARLAAARETAQRAGK